MQASHTEEFLWNLCKVLNFTGSFLSILLSPPRTMGQVFIKLDELSDRNLNDKDREELHRFIYSLKARGYIEVRKQEGSKAIMITKRGIGKAFKASFKQEKKIKRKDGKWIMLIFDMPAKYKKSRDLLRSILLNLGYKMFQQSVWITPYDASDKTEELLRYYSLEKYVKLFLVERV